MWPHSAWPLLACTLMALPCEAQSEKSDTLQSRATEESGRNVMLNAASANGPREISIGLPGGDVNVLENGLPVVYNSNPHNINTHWRGDGSLQHTGLLKISETAITTGNIGYAVNSWGQLGTDAKRPFAGSVNYNTNHFGKQQFDVNVNGALGNGWYYSGSTYQNFDPGSFKLRFAQYQDRTEIYKFALSKVYAGGRGRLSAIYHYSNSHWLSNATTGAPFIYVGDGSVREIPGFSLGTTSYLPGEPSILYMDMRDGKVKEIGGDGRTHFLKADVPLRNIFGYATGVRSISKGTALYSMKLLGYRPA